MNKYAYDIWHSDSNDHHCLGVIAIETDKSVEDASWDVLEKALKIYAVKPDEWTKPYMSACAVIDYHFDDKCECSCHDTNNEGCSECWYTESISVEQCTDPENHYYQHQRISIDELLKVEISV